MKVDMNVDMSDFMQACEATISRVSRGTRVAAQEGGAAILQIAQAKCPRYTGTLMNSGRLSVEGSSSNSYAQGFSATISFGGGDAVNPLTGKHPSEYAAAVHEGFAINPITGEISSYKSGEPKFLERAIRLFEQSGLQKVAYKHWGSAIDMLNDRATMTRMGAIYEGPTVRGALGAEYLSEWKLGVQAMSRNMDASFDSSATGAYFAPNIRQGGATWEVKRFSSGELKADPAILGSAMKLASKRGAPSDLSLTRRPESLYRRGKADTISELAYYLADLNWGGAEFAAERASKSIQALASKYARAGYTLKGNDKLAGFKASVKANATKR